MEQKNELVKVKATIEAFAYRKSNGSIALMATKPSRLLYIEEIIQNSKEKMEE